ncbi:cytochrome ubiquinol oxidase subunit I [Seleniivibrio sp.]|uniref:cytochrome ubiquinol oxidase subunit I n=1 Tax=Seleniivibrio sp. TaxID=2898801 RepID=UPI0025DCCF57|nr:cytochrome ubiquinol oxidase subunit I [Seleniivibrio sp.]MCD8554526.1 cytochrome ubiquinol oxidase subunit I [Seleniivibrio sp.]
MDAIALSRLQFALTAGFHWIFVPLTLGLIILTAFMETMYVRTGNQLYLRMTKFWGKLFLINFAIGVVTGITMEFQFGMNWAEYSKYVGDIFGAPLAIEATVAFFLESTFLGIWIFGWKKISKKAHLFAVWMVALGSNLSALWILIANAWMQHPVGYVLNNGRAEMVDFGALIFSSSAWVKFFHSISSGWVVAAFFVMGVSAYHILRKNEVEFFKKSLKFGAVFGLAATIFLAVLGDSSGIDVAKHQPSKFAAMESLWETQNGAPSYLFAVPDSSNEKNSLEFIPVPKMASFLAFHDVNAEVKGLKEFSPDLRPPVGLTFFSFRFMIYLGVIFIVLSCMALYYSNKDTIENKTLLLKILLYSIPLPYIAGQLGWIVAEVGRQPWIVYGLMKTSDAVSVNLTPGHVILSLVGFVGFYTLLGVIDIFLLVKYSKKGPERA